MGAFVVLVHTDRAPLTPGDVAACRAALGGGVNEPVAVCPAPHVCVLARSADMFAAEGGRWIVADARLDERAALARELGVDEGSSDAAVILAAVARWGDRCAERLMGDFAFVSHDPAGEAFLCARDPFGVRPLYLALHGRALAVSSTLSGALAHPAFPRDPDDTGVFDFLVTGGPLDEHTAFAAVERVLPARTLSWQLAGPIRSRRYWSLPIEPPMRFRRSGDCVAAFKDLLAQAVRDRLRDRAVAITLSGGMDSASIAALAASEGGHGVSLRGVSVGYERVLPDEELRWARQVAAHVGIPLEVVPADGFAFYAAGASVDPPVMLRDRSNDALTAAFEGALASHAGAALTGYGGDPVLFPSKSYFPRELRGGRVAGAVRGVIEFRQRAGRWPPLYVRTALRGQSGIYVSAPDVPPWLAETARASRDDRARWDGFRALGGEPHPTRPEAYRLLSLVDWQRLFETDSRVGLTRLYPFFDLRLVRFALRIPPVPWFEDKLILREAMRGVLPEAVRKRPKSPLAANPLQRLVTDADAVERFKALTRRPALAQYLDLAALRDAVERDVSANRKWLGRVWSLADWLETGRFHRPAVA